MTPTTKELIEMLAPLDAKATKGKWYYSNQSPNGKTEEWNLWIYGNPYVDDDGTRVSTGIGMICGNRTSSPMSDANAGIAAFIGTHRAAILAALRRVERLERVAEAAEILRGCVHENEGGVPRYYTTNGAAMNAAVEMIDAALSALDQEQ